MPINIPTYGGPKVATAPLPGEKLNPNAPSAAFGVPAEIPLGGMQQVAGAIFEDEQRKANNSAVLGFAADLSKAETEMLYGPAGHPELGALNQQGEKALGVPDQVQKDWQKRVSDLTAQHLHNDTQREAAARLVNDYGANIFSAVQRHVSGEVQQMYNTNAKAMILNEQDAAAANYQDPQRVDASVQRQIAVLQGQAEHNGWTPPQLKQAIADTRSTTYLRTLELMSTAHDPNTKAYFEAHQQDFQGQDAVHAQQMTKETTIRQAGFKAADDIVGKATDRVNAMELAKNIADPDVREFAQRQLEEHYNVLKQGEAEQLNQNYIAAKNIIDAHPGVKDVRSIIPPKIWRALTVEHAESLTRYAKGDVPNNDQKWLAFLDLRPQQLGTMDAATYYSQYRTNFDQQHQNVADAQWAAARDAVANGRFDDPKLTEFYSDNQRVWLSLRNSGLLSDPNQAFGKLNNNDANLVNQTLEAVAREVNSYEQSTLGGKRKATPVEKQEIIDNMIQQKVFVDRPWLPDREKVAVVLSQDEKNRAYVPMEQIPTTSAQALQNMLKSRGQKVNKDVVQRAYAAQLIDGRDLIIQMQDPNSALNKILAGMPLPPQSLTPVISPAKPIIPSHRDPGGALGSAFRGLGNVVGGGLNPNNKAP